jgi:serine/threonine-protein kinase
VYKVVREEHGITDYSALKVITIPKSSAELNALRADGYDETAVRSYLQSIVTDFKN